MERDKEVEMKEREAACALGKSRRDNTLLTVGFNLRTDGTQHQVPQGRHFANPRRNTATPFQKGAQVSSLRDFSEGGRYRRLKPTVNKVLSLRDWAHRFGKCVMATALMLALMLATATHAQEAFDAEKTKALFAGTEWNSRYYEWRSDVSFAADGTLTIKASGYGDKDRTEKWTPSGPRSVKGDNREWEISPDGKEVYASGRSIGGRIFIGYYRGKSYPPEYPILRGTVAKPGIVWVQQGVEERRTCAFNGELDLARGTNGEEQQVPSGLRVPGGGQFSVGSAWFFLVPDGKGGWLLRESNGSIYKPEPALPSDPLPPQMISRARSPFSGTTWCRIDGTGKLHSLTFAANGTVSTSAFPQEKPEWNPYDNGSIRYKIKGDTYSLTLDADKKRLVRENSRVREIWFAGRQPPKVGMTEEKLLKDILADESKAWVHWDANQKTVYTFDSKTKNVSIIVDDGKPTVVRWSVLCAGCIRIGDEAFMIEGETLERVEPRLTLKQVAKDSVK